MKQQVSVQKNGTNYREDVVLDLPSVCPHCNGKMNPTVWEAITPSTYNETIETIAVLAQCITCLKFFAVEYDDSYTGKTPYESNRLVPYTYNPLPEIIFDQMLKDFSPDFVEIYTQALSAENIGLDRISGISYRKALEFLIKDFCIYRHPSEEETIKKLELSKVIKNYLDAQQSLKTLALASSWVGNDEAHYVKRHEDLDLSDLKILIKATQHAVSQELALDKAKNITAKK